jgi:hypothetical protein
MNLTGVSVGRQSLAYFDRAIAIACQQQADSGTSRRNGDAHGRL